MATHKRSNANSTAAEIETAATTAAVPAAESGVPAGPRPGTRAHSALQRYTEGKPPYNRDPAPEEDAGGA